MTREQEIEKAIYNYSKKIEERMNGIDYFNYENIEHAFIDGIEWADANPKSTWISVKERLPIEEKDGLSTKVLVLNTKNKVDFSRYDYDVGGWISTVLDIEFTHWMPIPKLPNK